MLLKQRNKNKAKLEIPLLNETFHLQMSNIPGTDIYVLPKKDNYIILQGVLKKYIDESKEMSEKDYLNYYNTRLGYQIPNYDEELSTNALDDMSLESNPLFSENNSQKSLNFELEKYYDETELEWVNQWKWVKPEKATKKDSEGSPDKEVNLVPTKISGPYYSNCASHGGSRPGLQEDQD